MMKNRKSSRHEKHSSGLESTISPSLSSVRCKNPQELVEMVNIIVTYYKLKYKCLV